MAACEAIISKAASRSGAKTFGTKVIFKIEGADQLALLDQRKAEHGSRAVPAEILVFEK
jgi:hypothetical protein